MSDNEIYLLIKYIKDVLWRVAKRLPYIEDARCLKVKNPPRLSRRFKVILVNKNPSHEFVPRIVGCVSLNWLVTNLTNVFLLM